MVLDLLWHVVRLSLDDGNDVPSINITLIKRNKMQKIIPSGLFLFGFVYALKVES